MLSNFTQTIGDKNFDHHEKNKKALTKYDRFVTQNDYIFKRLIKYLCGFCVSTKGINNIIQNKASF
jgi:hypothetical protein